MNLKTGNITIAAALAAFACLGCASVQASGEQARDDMSEKTAARLANYEETGETVSCLNVTRIRSIDALDDKRFLVTATGGDYYLNETSGRCSGAGRFGNALQYTISGGSLCRNQIIDVIDSSTGMTVGACGLGSFEKLNKKPAQ